MADASARRAAVINRLNGQEDFGIMVGMALAAAFLVRDFDQPTLAREILGAAGLSAAWSLETLQLEDYDLRPLLQIVK